MDTHEYQAKTILRKYGIPMPDFAVASTMHEVQCAIEVMNLDQAVIKVQVHAGGRGKAGGVQLARNREEILKHAQNLLGMRIQNAQTGKQGIVAHQILLSPLVDYRQEYYLGAVIDRARGQGMLIISPEGGMEIEKVAAQSPEKVMALPITLDGRLRSYQLVQIAKFMGWTGDSATQGKHLIQALARAFVETDASLLEINPLVQTSDGKLLALDAKLSVDDNALYRQPEIAAYCDLTQLPPNEVQARAFDLAYVALDGDIGCMVNGAGLAMATMDIIQYYGGRPANFLDVGGGASQDKVTEGFKIILGDPQVKAILVNIFGGIMDCGVLAAGIVAATRELKVEVPLIVRLEGTNVEIGKKTIQEAQMQIQIAHSLEEGALQAVQAAKEFRR